MPRPRKLTSSSRSTAFGAALPFLPPLPLNMDRNFDQAPSSWSGLYCTPALPVSVQILAQLVDFQGFSRVRSVTAAKRVVAFDLLLL